MHGIIADSRVSRYPRRSISDRPRLLQVPASHSPPLWHEFRGRWSGWTLCFGRISRGAIEKVHTLEAYLRWRSPGNRLYSAERMRRARRPLGTKQGGEQGDKTGPVRDEMPRKKILLQANSPLCRQDMKEIFDPTINQVIEFIARQELNLTAGGNRDSVTVSTKDSSQNRVLTTFTAPFHVGRLLFEPLSPEPGKGMGPLERHSSGTRRGLVGL
jgi:hypothetical protein